MNFLKIWFGETARIVTCRKISKFNHRKIFIFKRSFILAAAAVESVSSLSCWTCNAPSLALCQSTGSMVACPGSESGGDNGGDPEPIGSDYNIYPNAGLNFEDSQAACEAEGGYLIVPNTQASF